MKTIHDITEFDRFIASDQPVVVKFFADWCPDCKRLDIYLPSVLEELPNIPFQQINKDELSELAERHQVMGIPSLLVFKNGEKIGHLHSANAKTPEEVQEFLATFF
ncbi:thioredoxin family protein [Cytobacillus spongiae]|uniref:thioredoxin family protein n=1 Tax=Cytobacillus spongiae TaxID=2901381 RepID=UPI001F3162C0|nr:thioredoxin family protein [Cytobacillus spongiae]UII54160.1 thioredoxin family protein [Cytobacillus spongiae]